MKKIFLLILVCFFSHNFPLAANRNPIPGDITLGQLMQVCPEINNYVSQLPVHGEISGKEFTLGEQKYEWRYFSFSDPKGVLPENTTFKQYVEKNKIQDLKSVITRPVEGLEFESFDFSRAKLDDGIYFSMAFRRVPEDYPEK